MKGLYRKNGKNKIKITSKETHERNNKVNIFIPVMKNKKIQIYD